MTFPELWKVPLVAGDEVVRPRGVGTLDENVIARIVRDLDRLDRRHDMGCVSDELKELLAKALADF